MLGGRRVHTGFVGGCVSISVSVMMLVTLCTQRTGVDGYKDVKAEG